MKIHLCVPAVINQMLPQIAKFLRNIILVSCTCKCRVMGQESAHSYLWYSDSRTPPLKTMRMTVVYGRCEFILCGFIRFSLIGLFQNDKTPSSIHSDIFTESWMNKQSRCSHWTEEVEMKGGEEHRREGGEGCYADRSEPHWRSEGLCTENGEQQTRGVKRTVCLQALQCSWGERASTSWLSNRERARETGSVLSHLQPSKYPAI